MKLLLFSDLHCDEAATRSLVDRAAAVDVVIGAGDFAIKRQGIQKTVHVLRQIRRPTILVPGNGESVEELSAACRGWPSAHILHGSGVTIAEVPFYGIGGGVPVTPFGEWSYDFSEAEATELLRNCPRRCVLVSHSPPKGVVDLDASGNNIGSTAVRDAVLENSPILLVCGHVHACWRQIGELGSTPVVNAGPQGIEWTLIV
jgi:Icc-related predicted phosphoesterase